MNRDMLDAHPLFRSPLLIDFKTLQCIQRLQAINHSPEDSVLAIKMGRRRKEDEELAAVRIESFVGHAHDPTRAMAQRRTDLILEELIVGVVYGSTAFGLWVARRRTRLYHEGRNAPMEGRAIVEGRRAEGEKVL